MHYQSNLSQTRQTYHRLQVVPISYLDFGFGKKNGSVIPKERG
jgi:hypothetical protein